jgi:chloramphenicol-sensitive protein RarD
MFTGIATSTPLLLFGHATRKVSLTTLGILQFLSPTLQWLVAWRIYHEPMTPERTISFALIWLAIALYGLSSWKRSTAVSV